MTVYIYGLRCPLRGEIRYVGKSDDPKRRLRAHLGLRNPRHPKDCWIKGLVAKGLEPELVILREVADGDDWTKAEQDEIAAALARGLSLFNRTMGGEGAPLSDRQLAEKTARMRDPETRRRMSEAAKARWDDPAKREAAAAANRSPEKRARLAEAAKRRATPEYKAMMAAKSRAAWADREKRAKIQSGITDEVRQRVSRASKRFWATSQNADVCRANLKKASREVIEKAAKARMTPEHKAKMRKVFDDPDYRKKLSRAVKASWARRRRELECGSLV